MIPFLATPLLAATVLLAACVTDPERMTARATSRIDALMHDYDGTVPGASVLVVHDGVSLVYRSYGLANVEEGIAATPSTNYRLASVSKQFTAAAILLLAEDGRLSLDDRARQWLPSLPPATDAVSLRHLLTHTSGVIDYEDLMPAMPPLATGVGQLRDADVVRLLEAHDRTYFPPGTGYRYSNSGYALLARIVERASGRSFPAFLRERIFQPLGMHHTLAFVADGPAIHDRAYGYSHVDGRWARTDQSPTSAVLGDGGIYSSIDDLAQWDAALNDDRLLTAPLRQAAFARATRTDDPQVDYGFGWRITGDTFWHSGETIGFRNVIIRHPRQRLTVIVLSNRNDPEPYRLAQAIAQEFLPR